MITKCIQKLDFINGGPKKQYEIPFIDIDIRTYPLRDGYTISNPFYEYSMVDVTTCNPPYMGIQHTTTINQETLNMLREIVSEEVRNILGRENI